MDSWYIFSSLDSFLSWINQCRHQVTYSEVVKWFFIAVLKIKTVLDLDNLFKVRIRFFQEYFAVVYSLYIRIFGDVDSDAFQKIQPFHYWEKGGNVVGNRTELVIINLDYVIL